MANTPLRNYLVKAVDDKGQRWQYTTLAASAAHAEQLATRAIGLTVYLFVRRRS